MEPVLSPELPSGSTGPSLPPASQIPSSVEAHLPTSEKEALAGRPPAPQGPRDRSGFVEALVLVLVALVLALTLKTYVAEAYEIKGRSMESTFHDEEKVMVLKSFYGIARGDIIVFASRENPQKDLIKRVVGLPGETVKIVRGQVYINGIKLEECYAYHDARDLRENTREERVPAGHYYVLGDNRPDSHDSRAFQAIPESSIRGKVLCRWWPLSKFQGF